MAPTVANVSVYSSGNCLYVFVFLFLLKFFDKHYICMTMTERRCKWPQGINLDLPDLDYLLHYNSFRRGLPAAEPSVCKRWQGKRGRLHARLKARASRPPLPSLLVANVWSLEDKMDELRTGIISQWEVSDCCALFFTETWLSDNIPESAVRLNTHSHSPHSIIWEAAKVGESASILTFYFITIIIIIIFTIYCFFFKIMLNKNFIVLCGVVCATYDNKAWMELNWTEPPVL